MDSWTLGLFDDLVTTAFEEISAGTELILPANEVRFQEHPMMQKLLHNGAKTIPVPVESVVSDRVPTMIASATAAVAWLNHKEVDASL